jgi:hypothetical protein
MENKRDHEVFTHKGYMYTFDKYRVDKQNKLWRCRQKNTCLARIHTNIDNSSVLKVFQNNHIYDSEAAIIGKEIVITNIRKQALSTMNQTSCVINEYTLGISQANYYKQIYYCFF